MTIRIKRLTTVCGRRGFTAMELLAACALTALLMVVVLSILGSMAAQRGALLRRPAKAPWVGQLADQLRWDFANSRRLRWQRGKLILVGYGGRDFTNDAVTHRPTRVEYAVKSVGTRSWLTRRETQLDSRSNVNSRTELACAGVSRLELTSLDGKTIPQRREIPVPNRVRVTLIDDVEERPILDQIIFLH